MDSDGKIIEKNLLQAVANGELNIDAKDSNFIEIWYLMKYHKIKFIVDGVEHGPGWFKANMPNMETIRVKWSAIRNRNKKASDDAING